MRLRTPVISAACTPSHAEKAIDAVQLVAVRADLGDRGAAADHRHDALVVVVEGLARLAREVGEDVVGRRDAALQRDRAELRVRRRRRGWGCWRRRRSRRRPGAPSTVRSGCTSMRPPRPAAARPRRRRGGAMMPPPQTTQRVRIVDAVGERHVPGPDLGDRHAEVQADALACPAPWPRSRARCRRTAPSSVWPRSTRWICAAVTARSWYSALIVSWIRSASAPGHLDAGRPAADDDEVQRALVDQRRVAVGVLEDAEDARAQPLSRRRASRAGRRARRRRGCGRSSAASRRRGRARRRRSARRRSVVTLCVAGSSDATSAELDVDVGVVVEELAQREGDVARARAARSPPGRAAAGTGGSCCGRSA